jgi:hypothetical protein
MSQGFGQVYHNTDRLLHQFPDDEDRRGSRNAGLLPTQPPDGAASHRIFYCICDYKLTTCTTWEVSISPIMIISILHLSDRSITVARQPPLGHYKKVTEGMYTFSPTTQSASYLQSACPPTTINWHLHSSHFFYMHLVHYWRSRVVQCRWHVETSNHIKFPSLMLIIYLT